MSDPFVLLNAHPNPYRNHHLHTSEARCPLPHAPRRLPAATRPVPNQSTCNPHAGFRQWRALVSLFLQCERGPLSSHVPAFTAFTAALRAQLAMALSDAHQHTHGQQQHQQGQHGGVGVSAEGGGGALGLWGPHGPLVEEVLVGGGGRGCFLRHHLAGYFEVLREAAGVEQGLAREVRHVWGVGAW